MNEAAIEYVSKYRDLHARREEVKVLIEELRGVCESLKDWQATAKDLASTPFAEHRHWSDDRLSRLATLRTKLIEYHRVREATEDAWRKLKEADRLGLAATTSITLPTA